MSANLSISSGTFVPVIPTATPVEQKIVCCSSNEKLVPSDFHNHEWSNLGGLSIRYYPFNGIREILGVELRFQLNPNSGSIRIEIPQTEKRLCLEVNGNLIYSSGENSVFFELIPESNDVEIKTYEFKGDNIKWAPGSLFSIGSAKPQCLKVIPPEQRPARIQNLAVQESTRQPVIQAAGEWVGKGNYVPELPGFFSYSDENNRRQKLQEVKVISLVSIGNSISSSILKRSKENIENKEANMNCWQFCLLSYIEAGLLSWETVGHLYREIERCTYPPTDFRIPDALKCGRYSVVDFNDDHTTPRPGDAICFAKKLGVDWHCAIFKERIGETDTFSVIEHLSGPVAEEVYSFNHDYITFVRSQDVEDNVLNFLTHRARS